MSHPCCSPPEGAAPQPIDGTASRSTRVAAPVRPDGTARAADTLALAASPTFAAMALATGLLGDPAAVLCSAAPMPAVGGMATMYLLMSAFHAAPWLRLIRERGWMVKGRSESQPVLRRTMRLLQSRSA